MNRCAACHRSLTDPVSRACGLGPVCRERLGLKVAKPERQRALRELPALPPAVADQQLNLFARTP